MMLLYQVWNCCINNYLLVTGFISGNNNGDSFALSPAAAVVLTPPATEVANSDIGI